MGCQRGTYSRPLHRAVSAGTESEMFMRAPRIVRMLESAAKAWWDDDALRLGASLAYYTLFAIAPILLVATAIAGWSSAPRRFAAKLSDSSITSLDARVRAPYKVFSKEPANDGPACSPPCSAASPSSSLPREHTGSQEIELRGRHNRTRTTQSLARHTN